MLKLQCVAQQYDWGKLGDSSAVAQLKSQGEGTPVDPKKPYAEYWFGTHPSGPSRLQDGGDAAILLNDWLLVSELGTVDGRKDCDWPSEPSCPSKACFVEASID
jgi:mannose-6-phosphate isomerase